MLVMYEHSEKRLIERLKFDAGVHGIKLKDDPAQPRARDTGSKAVVTTKGKCIPGDPDSYSHLSMEERRRLTDDMMGRHKAWSEVHKPLGGKDPIDKG
uniref:Uncharacterized protein n=1 Tax=viral metagenome TaxID=1070528 RepID=A0A6M3KPU3_9ZZZZ